MFKFVTSITLAVACVLGLVVLSVGLFFWSLPDVNTLKGCLTTEMYHVHLCAKDPGYVKLRNISPIARQAFIVSEDGTFYTHHGFDWDEMKMSLAKNLQKKGYARGGSTISQQLAKNVFLSSQKSLLRKFKEALLTMRIEKNFSKDEILERYLNVVEFGPKLYGIGPASLRYFGHPPSELTAAEGAFLAFLMPNPKKYIVSFQKHQLTPFAFKQVHQIVERLHKFGRLDEGQFLTASLQVDSMFGGIPPHGKGDPDLPSEEENLDDEL